MATDDLDAAQLHVAAEHVQAAIAAVETATHSSTSAGPAGAVYVGWARHLTDDWRGLALLAARGDAGAGP
jgi:hypothetical protein